MISIFFVFLKHACVFVYSLVLLFFLYLKSSELMEK